MACVIHPAARVRSLIWRGKFRREALADGLRMDLQVESVCSSNPVHGLQLVGEIQRNNGPSKRL